MCLVLEPQQYLPYSAMLEKPDCENCECEKECVEQKTQTVSLQKKEINILPEIQLWW